MRPQTPPSATTSNSTLNGSKDFHASAAKKSRNPFGFLKKKTSAHSNASAPNPMRHEASMSSLSSRYGSNAANFNPLRPPAWLDSNRPLASTTSPSSASLRSNYHQPPAASSTPWQNPLSSRIDSLPAAISLEDELESEQQPRKDPRKRIKGVRHHLGKNATANDADSARDMALTNPSQSIEQEVELSLDMNFDQLEDFVDTNAARQRLQGSVTESTSPSDHRSPNPSEAGTYRSPSPSQASFDRQTSVASGGAGSSSHVSDGSIAQSSSYRNTESQQRRHVDFHLDLHHPQRPSPFADSSAAPQQHPRLSLAEMQNYQSLRKMSANLIDVNQASAYTPSALSTHPVGRDSTATSLSSPDSSSS